MIRAAIRRFLADERGTNALELALVTPLFVLIIIGIFAFGFVLWVENSIQSAAAQAARCAVVDNACASVSQIQNAAVGWALGAPIATANVTVNQNATCAAGVTGTAVAITYTATFFVISTTMSAESCYPALS
ncbi:MAG TPA: TadE/TadG family type IV pilus assembly protein [Stellaceae bacterium]|nr:TadE/TadG family type IV pilus assembly protein [Stellaceae bacterium]